MIDLSKESARVQAWMTESISNFLAEFPATRPVTVGLYSSPANGWISLCIDTRPEDGHIRTSCAEFTYPEYSLLEFGGWPEEYGLNMPMIKRHDSKVIRHNHSEGDDVFNGHFYEFLMRVINDYYSAGSDVFRPVWAGVRILDSRWVSFGRIHQPKT